MALAYGIPKEKLVAGVPFYGVTVYLVNKQDPCYLLAVNILGSDLDAVDQADQFFSVYTE